MSEARQRRGLTVIICSGNPHLPLSKQFWTLARSLAESGNRVILVVDRLKPEVAARQEPFEMLAWLSTRPVHWRDAISFWRLVRRCRPNAILASFASVNIAMIVGRLCGIAIRVAWYQTLSSAIVSDMPAMPRWREWLLVKRKALVYRQASHIVSASDEATEDIADRYGVSPEKCRVILGALSDPRDEFGSPMPANAGEGRKRPHEERGGNSQGPG